MLVAVVTSHELKESGTDEITSPGTDEGHRRT